MSPEAKARSNAAARYLYTDELAPPREASPDLLLGLVAAAHRLELRDVLRAAGARPRTAPVDCVTLYSGKFPAALAVVLYGQ